MRRRLVVVVVVAVTVVEEDSHRSNRWHGNKGTNRDQILLLSSSIKKYNYDIKEDKKATATMHYRLFCHGIMHYYCLAPDHRNSPSLAFIHATSRGVFERVLYQ